MPQGSINTSSEVTNRPDIGPARKLTSNASMNTSPIIKQPDSGVGCKLDPALYKDIANGLVEGRTINDLANSYGVSPSTVSVLRNRHFDSIPQPKQRLATKLGGVAEAAADRMLQMIEDGTVSDRALPVMAGVSIEKAMLLSGAIPTTRVEHISIKSDSIGEILDRLPSANTVPLASKGDSIDA
jgi:hypothetical protein